jgi:arylsulfatase A-like enzyme
MREVYYAAISMVDEQVGWILDALEETGQLDNTLIIFTSDHGELLGDYGLYQKWNPYDSCARVPFIIRFPKKVAPGSIFEGFVDLNDILPTILDLAELEYPGDYPLPGESLFSENPTKDRDWQYVEYAKGNRRWISIRNKDYKYNYYYGGGFEQLFDMESDPHETTNLLHGQYSPETAEIRAEMRTKLTAYEQEWGLEGYVGESDLKAGEPYQPHPQRNEAFPRFPLKIMDEAERALMNDFIEEIAAVVADEPLVKLSDLDITTWQTNLGISDADVARLLEMDTKKLSAT